MLQSRFVPVCSVNPSRRRGSRQRILAVLTLFLLSWFGISKVQGAIDSAELSKLKVGDSVVVHLDPTGRHEGTITLVDPNFIKVKSKFGEQKVLKEKIKSIERKLTPKEEYEAGAARCKTADDWASLGTAIESKDPDLAAKAYEEGLKLDPDHEGIRTKRGEMKHPEKGWIPEREYYEALGYEEFEGKFYPKEEVEAKRKERDERYAKTKRKDQLALEREYLGRNWADINPITSQNYIVYCDSTEEVHKGYVEVMEALHDKYMGALSRFGKISQDKRGEVYIFRHVQEFRDWTGAAPGIGGFYRPWLKDIHAYHGSFGASGDTYHVLAHEGTHQFQGFMLKNFYSCPMWIIEGMAVYFGDGSKRNRNGSIEVGLLPRDRLEQLHETIPNSYDAMRVDVLMMAGQPFSGFYYAPAWGIIYWCLKGDTQKVKAHSGAGQEIFNEFIQKLISSDQICDYPAEMARFKSLVESKTGKKFDQWENDYKDWIMKLPLEQIVKKDKANTWKSDSMGFTVTQPKGLVKDKHRQGTEEQIAFASTGAAKHRRISSAVMWNVEALELSEELARALVNSRYGEIEFDQEPTAKAVYGYETFESIFTGIPILISESDAGRQGGGPGASDSDASTAERIPYKCRAVVYASLDYVRVNLLEADPADYEAANAQFEQYLKDFVATN